MSMSKTDAPSQLGTANHREAPPGLTRFPIHQSSHPMQQTSPLVFLVPFVLTVALFLIAA